MQWRASGSASFGAAAEVLDLLSARESRPAHPIEGADRHCVFPVRRQAIAWASFRRPLKLIAKLRVGRVC